MRLLIVSNTYPPADISGVASLAYEMAHQLGAASHDVTVLTRRVDLEDGYALAVGGEKPAYPWRAGLRFLKLAREKPYTVIHVHESDGFFVVLFWALGRLFGRPWAKSFLVATLQVSYRQERRIVRPVKASGEVVSRPTREETRFAKKAWVHAFFGWATVKLADWVVAPSNQTRTELMDDYKARRVKVIHNGIAVDDLVSKAAKALATRQKNEPDSEVVIYAGRMRTRKAVAVLLKAFEQVLAERPKAELLLVGDGEQFDALQEQHRRLFGHDSGLEERVRFLGSKPRHEVFDLYAQADVYCLPSLYEGFPVATLEAMAVGLPVVTTRVSGNPEAVDDGVEGRVVEPKDADGLARALIDLLSDPEKRREMGRKARERVLRDFTIEEIVSKYQDLWKTLAADGAPSPSNPLQHPSETS